MNIDKIRLLDHAISNKGTGNPQDFARRLRMSKSMLHRYINYMKNELKAPIHYNRAIVSYEYTEFGKLNVSGWDATQNLTNK